MHLWILGSTLVAIIGIVLVSYGLYFGDFIAALILGILLAASKHKTSVQNSIRFNRCNISRTCKKC